MIENPYSPFDPQWHIIEAYLRKKREKKINEEIQKLFVAFRKRNMHLIFTTPNIPNDRLMRKLMAKPKEPNYRIIKK